MWGTIALPILAELYVRRKNVAALQALSRSELRTKLELAADLMKWIVGALRGPGSRTKIIALLDGSYAAARLWQPLAKRAGYLVEHRMLAFESVVIFDGGNELLGRPLRGTHRPQRPPLGHLWDNPDRRPSHADRRRYITRQMLERTFLQVLSPTHSRSKKQSLLQHLLALAT